MVSVALPANPASTGTMRQEVMRATEVLADQGPIEEETAVEAEMEVSERLATVVMVETRALVASFALNVAPSKVH
jgi:hypothetical protein